MHILIYIDVNLISYTYSMLFRKNDMDFSYMFYYTFAPPLLGSYTYYIEAVAS